MMKNNLGNELSNLEVFRYQWTIKEPTNIFLSIEATHIPTYQSVILSS